MFAHDRSRLTGRALVAALVGARDPAGAALGGETLRVAARGMGQPVVHFEEMGHPVTHFEVIGKDGEKLRSFYSDLFGWR